MADFGGADLDAFRTEARDWLEANFPPSLKGKGGMMFTEGREELSGDAAEWKKRFGDKGWGVPTWPKAYGGGGLEPAQARVLQQEMNRIGAWNPIGGMGVMMFGPTLLEYGNEAQKKAHIPPIVRGEINWCQGFSEPGAGSDLASLQTRAEDKGDHFLVNGSKIWTSGAQWADMCFCLVRTDTSKKHEGISFLLIDMHDPGVEVRPIKLIAGASPFCETFFTDVKVPKENLVGPLNGGWTIAKRLLQFERQGIGSAARAGQGGPGLLAGPPVNELAKAYVCVGDDDRLADVDLRRRITDHLMEAQAHALTGERIALEAQSNRGPSATSSIMKNAGTMIRKERAELAVEILGQQGIGWGGEGFSDYETSAIRVMLRSKSGTIAGGSQEVQNNIIAKRILGLPDTTHST